MGASLLAVAKSIYYFSGAASRMVSLSNYCIDVCVFNSNLMKPSVVFYVAI